MHTPRVLRPLAMQVWANIESYGKALLAKGQAAIYGGVNIALFPIKRLAGVDLTWCDPGETLPSKIAWVSKIEYFVL